MSTDKFTVTFDVEVVNEAHLAAAGHRIWRDRLLFESASDQLAVLLEESLGRYFTPDDRIRKVVAAMMRKEGKAFNEDDLPSHVDGIRATNLQILPA